MVLVDTSVWIRSLAGRAPYMAELDRLLELDEVAGHELVYGELLIGDRGGRKKLLAATSKCIRRPSSLMMKSSRLFASAICTDAAPVGSIFTFWPPRSWSGSSYGRSTRV